MRYWLCFMLLVIAPCLVVMVHVAIADVLLLLLLFFLCIAVVKYYGYAY